MAPDALMMLAAHLALLVGASSGLAVLLRLAGIPGGRPAAAVVGGLVAGILVGATVAGRVWPRCHEAVVAGGASQREALRALGSRQAADLAALGATGVTPAAVEELRAEHARERAAAEARVASAAAEHRRPRAFALVTMLAAALACTTWAGARPAPTASRGAAGEALGLVVAGVLATLLAALPAALLLRWLTDLSLEAALACGGAVAGGSVFAGLPLRWTPRSGRSVECRSLALCAATAATLLLGVGLRAGSAGWVLLPAAGMLAGAGAARVWPPGRWSRRGARAVVSVVVMPAAVAFLAGGVDWLGVWGQGRSTLLLAAGLLIAADGQFIGAWLGLHAAAPARLRARAAALGVDLLASGLGLTQAAMGVVLVAGGVLDPGAPGGQAAAALIVLNAALVEVMAPATRRAARALAARPPDS